MAGHTADHIHRRSGGSNSEAQWRVTLRITFIGDREGQTQRQWRVTLGITFIGDLEGQTQRLNGGSHCWRVKLRGALAGHTADHIHRGSGGSNSEAQWRVTLGITFTGDLEGQTQRRNGGSHCGSHS